MNKTTITLQNYAESVRPFCSPMPLAQHNSHMIMGIIEEFESEIKGATDIINLREEVGDFLWYVSQYCIANQINFASLVLTCLSKVRNELPIDPTLMTLLHITKKELAYNNAPTEHQRLIALISCMDCLLTETTVQLLLKSTTIEQILQINFDKLYTRYGHKFSEERAINRDLAEERAVLEN